MRKENIWQIRELLQLLNAEILMGRCEAGAGVSGIFVDTNLIKNESCMFIALKGRNDDGHNYIHDAIAKGARVIVVKKGYSATEIKDILVNKKEVLILSVEEPLEALYILAKASRSRYKEIMVAVTGSVGKTTTKDLLHYMVSTLYQKKSFKTYKTFNNWMGVNLMLSNLPESCEIAFFEIGTNHPGEIEVLSKLLKPDIAIITTVTDSHIGNFGSTDNIMKEKMSIIKGLGKEGILLTNVVTNPWLKANRDQYCNIEIITFGGISSDWQVASYSLAKIEGKPKLTTYVKHLKKEFKVVLSLTAEHWSVTSALLRAFCNILGDKTTNCLDLTYFELAGGRGKVLNLNLRGKDITVIDDSFNAQKSSMIAAIKNLAYFNVEQFAAKRRLICVLGYMSEQGELSEKNHLDLTQPILEVGVNKLYLSGEPIKPLMNFIKQHIECVYNDDPKVISDIVLEDVQDGDVILIKGSRVTVKPRMHVVVEKLISA